MKRAAIFILLSLVWIIIVLGIIGIRLYSRDSYESLLDRGKNYETSGQYNLAVIEYSKALFKKSSDSGAYICLSLAFEKKGWILTSFAFIRKAAMIDPYNNSACYNIGRHYNRKGSYDDAIIWFEKALKIAPRRDIYLHAIARSYQNKGDTANAVKYFQMYLKVNPHAEHEKLVKKYLVSVKADVPETGTENDIAGLMVSAQFRELEERFTKILRERKDSEAGGSMLSEAYRQVSHNPSAPHGFEKWLKYLNDWQKSNPSSHFANACLGMFYIDYAWNARGSSWSNTLTDEGLKRFKERLETAGTFLEAAYETNPSDPVVPAALITVARGLNLPKTEMEKQFQRALRADRRVYDAYHAKLVYLMPKWHGSEEEMFAFARETVKNAPEDSFAPSILLNAHWEMHYISERKTSGEHFKLPKVWREIKETYSLLEKRFPESNDIHNWFAVTAYLAGDMDTAKNEILLVGDDWYEGAWGSYKNFSKVKKELLGVE